MATHVVTGAFSYTGKYIARRLLAEGHTLRTLTGRPRPDDPLASQIEAFPLDFRTPETLADAMRGADTLYNTYWIRFARGELTFERAVENSRALIGAAVTAGVRRVVHISVTNASSTSSYGSAPLGGLGSSCTPSSSLATTGRPRTRCQSGAGVPATRAAPPTPGRTASARRACSATTRATPAPTAA